MTPTDTLREAVAAGVSAAVEVMRPSRRPPQSIYGADQDFGAQEMAARRWYAEQGLMAALSAIEAAGWRVVKANMFDHVSNDVAEMPNSADEVTPVAFRTAFEIERDRIDGKIAAPRLDPTVRGEEG